jgi:hypothetical protein
MDLPLLPEIVRNYLVPLYPGRSLSRTLDVVSDETLRVHALSPVLERNQAYSQMLISLNFLSKRVSEWEAEGHHPADRERIILGRVLGLLGKSAARNFVACIRFGRIVGKGLPRKAQEKAQFNNPRDVIKLAITAEEFCQERKWIHSEYAFEAGLHYDFLSGLLTARKAPAEAVRSVEETFKEGLRIARIAYGIGQKIENVPHGNRLFGAALLVPSGKILMQLIYPKTSQDRSWAAWLKESEKMPPEVKVHQATLENRRFEWNHAELSSLIASSFARLRPLSAAIRYYQEPYYLKEAQPELHLLAGLLSVSATVSNGFPLQRFHRQWLAQVGITEESLVSIRKEALT